MKILTSITLMTVLFTSTLPAKVDLVTLPKRDSVQLTIYNSEDLTLVRDSRALTLVEGPNKLQFSWANTLIDPTSIDLLPRAHADQIDVLDLVYPPRTQNLGIWNIVSAIGGRVPVDILYFTSGLSWRAFYMATLSADETQMDLEAYVVITNKSGEDYDEAETRLVIGQVHLLDKIADLSRRTHPYGRPGVTPRPVPRPVLRRAREEMMPMVADMAVFAERPKEIEREALSEYYLYTIPGTESIPSGWSKRLENFRVDDIPVRNLYKFDDQRYGNQVVRFLSFANDKKHGLGTDPIPGGSLKVYRKQDRTSGALSYEGQSSFQYIPVGEDVELNMGTTRQVLVEATLVNYATDNYLFDNEGDVAGWIETRDFKVDVNNTRPVPARVEITRHFNTHAWTITHQGDYGEYEQIDLDTVRYTLDLPPRTKRTFTYQLTTRHGIREDETRGRRR